jgi:hypothetical protein
MTLNGGKVYFNRLTTIAGDSIPLDITCLPEDAMILLVSADPHNTTGLKGNIYDLKDDKEAVDRLSN